MPGLITPVAPVLSGLPRRPPCWRAAFGVAHAGSQLDPAGRARHGAHLRQGEERHPAGGMAVLRAVREGDQCAQEGAQRRHPGSQLPDAGNLQRRRRRGRRLAAARQARGQDQRGRHRPMRRAFHGRDVEDAQSRQDRAHPGPEGRLLARRLHHRRRRAVAARALSRRADRGLRQYLGRRESGGGHLLHVVERRAGGGEHGQRHGDLPAGPLSGQLRGFEDEGEDHRLARRLRGARALHRRGAAPLSGERSGDPDHRASRMPARRDRRGGLRRLDRAHDRLGESEKPKRVVMVTECSMADNVAAETTGVEFVRPCNLCPHMKRITLPKILDSLVFMREEVVIDPIIAERARRSVERMVNLKS